MGPKKGNGLFGLVVLVVVFVLGLKNYQNANFWDANFVQIITLVMTAVLSFFFVQHLTDKRRKTDLYDK